MADELGCLIFMRRFYRVFPWLIGVLGLLAFFSKVLAQQPAVPDAMTSVSYRTGLEKETFLLINKYREANHFPRLEWNETIAQIARGHSRDMASGDVDFGHDGFDHRVSELKDAMPGLRGAGENVLETSDPNEVARAAVTMWLHSPHHLKNIRGEFNYSGLGVWVNGEGAIYFTQIFVKIEAAVPVAPTPAQPAVSSPFTFLAPPKSRP